MSVINAYVEANIAAGKLAAAAQSTGAEERQILVTFNPAAADSDGSIYRIAKALSPDLILRNALICNEVVTGGTDWDLGLYEPLNDAGVGAVVIKDCYLNGGDLSSAHASGSELSAISAVAAADRVKRIYEIAGHTQTTKKAAYDIALTANVVGSGTGAITVLLTLCQG